MAQQRQGATLLVEVMMNGFGDISPGWNVPLADAYAREAQERSRLASRGNNRNPCQSGGPVPSPAPWLVRLVALSLLIVRLGAQR